MLSLKTSKVLLLMMCLGLFSCSPKPFSIASVNNASWKADGLKEVKVTLDMVVKNPNFYTIKLDQPKFLFEMEGMEVKWESDERWKLKPGKHEQQVTINFPLKKNIIGATKSLAKYASGKDLNLRIQGQTTAKVLLFKKQIVLNENVKVDF